MHVKRILSSRILLWIEVGMLVFFGFNVGKAVIKKRAIDAQISALEQEIALLNTEQDDLSQLLEYIGTDDFVEYEARTKLNMVKEGEHVVVIPDADVQSPAKELGPKEVEGFAARDTSAAHARASSNAERWWKYFFAYDTLWLE